MREGGAFKLANTPSTSPCESCCQYCHAAQPKTGPEAHFRSERIDARKGLILHPFPRSADPLRIL